MYDSAEEHKARQKSPLLTFDDKKSLSDEEITEIENQIGEDRNMRTQSDLDDNDSSSSGYVKRLDDS